MRCMVAAGVLFLLAAVIGCGSQEARQTASIDSSSGSANADYTSAPGDSGVETSDAAQLSPRSMPAMDGADSDAAGASGFAPEKRTMPPV